MSSTPCQAESQFDAGQYAFKVHAPCCVSLKGAQLTFFSSSQIEERTFSMAEYTAFVASIEMDVRAFRAKQASAVAAVEAR